jgi:hypothetical protein
MNLLYYVHFDGGRRSPKKCESWAEVLDFFFDITDFQKNYRHSENDGKWSGGYWSTKYAWIGIDEEGKRLFKLVNTHYNPRIFKRHPYQVIDSLGRVIPSTTIKQDLKNHVKAEKQRSYWYRSNPTSYRHGNWQRFRGDHGGMTSELRETVYHELEQEIVREEYGVTYKIRGRRKNDLPEFWWQWEDRFGVRRTKGWKRTRKKKQWM